MTVDNELHDLGDAASMIVERLVEPVEGMHRIISGRAFRYVGPPGAPVRAVHDTVVGGVYESIRRAAGWLGTGVGAMLAARLPAVDPVSSTSPGAGLQAALNAVWGDELEARGNTLAVSLSVRAEGRAVALDAASLAAAFPSPTDHIVVLLHGLGQTEQCWLSPLTDGAPGLHERMVGSSRLSPVGVRYNSGLPVAQTGAELAGLVESLSESWPVTRPRISFVGYSMGGLVARSAYAAGIAAGHEWVRDALDLVTVGAPHHGSPVARGLRIGSQALGIARTSRPLRDFLETASAGIKDMEDGAGVATAWEEAAALPPGEAGAIRQHFVAAVVTGDPAHPFGVLAGDLIVRVSSAAGHRLAPENVRVLASRRHFSLLADPDVAGQVIDWLETDSIS